MKVTFTGKQDKLTPVQERKLATQFGKLSKLLERRGEKVAQVALSSERHLHHAEVRLNVYGQSLVGAGSGPDQFTALYAAVEKVEKQAVKMRTKFRDSKRDTPTRTAKTKVAPEVIPVPPPVETAPKAAPKASKGAKGKAAANGHLSKPSRVVKSKHGGENGKPMTVEEAMLAMEEDRDYMVYRDAETDKVSVLIRRRDGKVDLVEA